MNKKLLAVAIPAVLFAGNVSAFEAYSSDEGSVEIYGQLRAAVKKAEDKEVTLDDAGSRTGVNALYSINDQFDVLGTVEYSLSYKNGDENLKNRLGYMGVAGDFGQVTLGKQYLTTDDLWGVDNSYFYGGSHIVEGAVSGGKHDNTVRYIFDSDAIYVDASYALPEDGAYPEVYELLLSKTVADFNITAAVSYASQDHAKFDVKDKDENVLYSVGAGSIDDLYYTVWVDRNFGDLNVGVQYAASNIDSDATNLKLDRDGYTLALSYALNEKAAVYGGYELTEYDLKGGTIGTVSKDDFTNVYVGAVHKFNAFFRVFAEAAYSDGKTPGFSNSKTEWKVGPSAVDGETNFALGARVYW